MNRNSRYSSAISIADLASSSKVNEPNFLVFGFSGWFLSYNSARRFQLVINLELFSSNTLGLLKLKAFILVTRVFLVNSGSIANNAQAFINIIFP